MWKQMIRAAKIVFTNIVMGSGLKKNQQRVCFVYTWYLWQKVENIGQPPTTVYAVIFTYIIFSRFDFLGNCACQFRILSNYKVTRPIVISILYKMYIFTCCYLRTFTPTRKNKTLVKITAYTVFWKLDQYQYLHHTCPTPGRSRWHTRKQFSCLVTHPSQASVGFTNLEWE